MKVYEAVYTEEQNQGVYGISLVENPAMQDEWIALSEQKEQIEFSAVNESKRLLLGAVLIPNKKIYRTIGGNEFYITFTEDTIGKLAHDFIKNGFQNNSSEEHETRLQDVSFVESWQVEDSEKDKSALYGKKYEPGTWVTMAKVSPEIYEKATNGTFKGFSIDALLSLQEINFKSEIDMNEETKKSIVSDVIDGVKALFNSNKEVEQPVAEIEVKPEEVKAEEVAEEVIEDANDRDFDVEAFKAEITEILKAEFKAQLDEKQKEVEKLKVELSKQPEEETVTVSPEVKKEVKLNEQVNFKREGIKQRVFRNLAENVW